VTLTPNDDGAPLSFKTDWEGQVTFGNVKEGSYRLKGSRRALLVDVSQPALGADGRFYGAEAVREEIIEVKGSAKTHTSADKRLFDLILPCSTQWALQGNFDVSFEIGIGVSYYQFYIFNRATQGIRGERERRRNIAFAGPGIGLGVSLPIPSASGDENSPGILKNEPAEFETSQPVHFEDFRGLGYIYTQLEINTLVGPGWAWQYASFAYIDHGPQIDIGGFQLAGAGAEAFSLAAGRWFFLD
jgi:hypothetical protein